MRNWADNWFMGVQCTQYAVDLILWECLLNRYSDVKHIMELGTFWGGFSLFLLLQATQRDIKFTTFDNGAGITRYETEGPLAVDTRLGKLLNFAGHYVHGDIFEESYQAVVDILGRPGRCLLFCDDGNKPKEFATFAPLTKPGDIVVVHDWETEIFAKDINYELVDEIMVEECGALGSMSRFFIRKDKED